MSNGLMTVPLKSHSCSEMLVRCAFESRAVDCSKIFEAVATDEGLCCSFNAMPKRILHKNYGVRGGNFGHFQSIERHHSIFSG